MQIEKDRYIAHRGLYDAKNQIPENSMPAFEQAVIHQYAIELDVHLTKDRKVVVFHDSLLERMTGAKGRIEDRTYEELQSLTLSGSEEKIPLLEAVLQLVQGRVDVFIEIKNGSKIGALEQAVLELLPLYPGEYRLLSFNPFSVWWLQRHAPHRIRGQLAAPKEKNIKCPVVRYLLGKMVFNFITKPDFICYNREDITMAFYQKFHKKQISVLSFTIQNEEQEIEALEISDGIIFEGYFPSRR